jgi:1-acyl-sn-glycerol-3-phosphate acyltransferase
MGKVIPLHAPPAEPPPPAREESVREESAFERKLAGGLAFLRRRITGDYPVDDFGFDPDLTEHVLLPPLRPLYEKWFRVETRGLHNVPDTGGALVVANHSGTVPLDAVMTALALLDHHPAHRHLRMLGADLVFALPVVAPLARKAGHTLACNPDAERLLAAGELVGVWPEGFKGIGKPFHERYKLQRFGRGGFVSAALRTGVPIIPCSIVGAEETYPMIANARVLARLLGLPYFPITPTFPLLGPLGAVPLPSKWIIEFGEPIETADLGGAAARRTRCWSSTSPTRCARRSSRRCTPCCSSAGPSSSSAGRPPIRPGGTTRGAPGVPA